MTIPTSITFESNLTNRVYPQTVATISTSPSNNLMTLSPLAESLLDTDIATLIKAGYLTVDLQLTDKGTKAVTAMIFATYKKELVVKANAELKTEKKA